MIKLRKTEFLTVLGLSILYFLFLVSVYRFHYFVPDFHAYQGFGDAHPPSVDGFSSLFLLISSYISRGEPSGFILLSAILMTIGLGSILTLLLLEVRSTVLRILGIAGILSCSLWYYIYGKNYYDFPFTVAALAPCFLLLPVFEAECRPNRLRLLAYGIALAAGFALSWKPYNVFSLGAIFSLLFVEPNIRRKLTVVITHRLGLVLSFLFFVVGYLCGNFRLLTEPAATFHGISAYPASSNFLYFLLNGDRIQWDHINALPFHYSTMLISTAFVILVVLPLVVRRYAFILSGGIICLIFYIFIRYFSPGHPWHGFNLGLGILVYLIFLLRRLESAGRIERTIGVVAVLVAVVPQAVYATLYYIPKQILWTEQTDAAVATVDTKGNEIFHNVRAMVDGLEGSYYVLCDLKRYQAINVGRRNLLVWAHEFLNFDDWKILESSPRYQTRNSDYIVRILLPQIHNMSDVVDDIPVEILPTYHEESRHVYDGYALVLYKLQNS